MGKEEKSLLEPFHFLSVKTQSRIQTDGENEFQSETKRIYKKNR